MDQVSQDDRIETFINLTHESGRLSNDFDENSNDQSYQNQIYEQEQVLENHFGQVSQQFPSMNTIKKVPSPIPNMNESNIDNFQQRASKFDESYDKDENFPLFATKKRQTPWQSFDLDKNSTAEKSGNQETIGKLQKTDNNLIKKLDNMNSSKFNENNSQTNNQLQKIEEGPEQLSKSSSHRLQEKLEQMKLQNQKLKSSLQFLAKGGDIYQLQEILGEQDQDIFISVLQVYRPPKEPVQTSNPFQQQSLLQPQYTSQPRSNSTLAVPTQKNDLKTAKEQAQKIAEEKELKREQEQAQKEKEKVEKEFRAIEQQKELKKKGKSNNPFMDNILENVELAINFQPLHPDDEPIFRFLGMPENDDNTTSYFPGGKKTIAGTSISGGFGGKGMLDYRGLFSEFSLDIEGPKIPDRFLPPQRSGEQVQTGDDKKFVSKRTRKMVKFYEYDFTKLGEKYVDKFRVGIKTKFESLATAGYVDKHNTIYKAAQEAKDNGGGSQVDQEGNQSRAFQNVTSKLTMPMMEDVVKEYSVYDLTKMEQVKQRVRELRLAAREASKWAICGANAPNAAKNRMKHEMVEKYGEFAVELGIQSELDTELNMSPQGKLRRKALRDKDEAEKRFLEFSKKKSNDVEGVLNLTLKRTTIA